MNRRAFLHATSLSLLSLALTGAAPATASVAVAWDEAKAHGQMLIVLIARDGTHRREPASQDWAWAASDWLTRAPNRTLALLAAARVVVARRTDLSSFLHKHLSTETRLLVVRPAHPQPRGWVRLSDADLRPPEKAVERYQSSLYPDGPATPAQREEAQREAERKLLRAYEARVDRIDRAFRRALRRAGGRLPPESATAVQRYRAALRDHAPEGGQWCWVGGCGSDWEGDNDTSSAPMCGMGRQIDNLTGRFLGLLHNPI